MPKFLEGDIVQYINEEFSQREGTINGIKVLTSEVTGRPIYWIIWNNEEERYSYGIHEGNLKLIKRKDPDWEV
jgi:heat shock protein HspQ